MSIRTLLASCSCVAVLGADLAAQCTPFFLPAGGQYGADLSVWGTAPWDPDGPGPTGNLVVAVGGFSSIGGAFAKHVAAWDPTTGLWSGLPGVVYADALTALGLPNGDLVVGGWLQQIQGVPQNGIARWNGAQWLPFGSGLNGIVYALLRLPNGDLLAGGSFTLAGGSAANRVARWDGATWSALGGGVDNTVFSLGVLPNGDVVAGGMFTTAGGVTVQGLARWDGSAWSAVGGGGMPSVMSVCVLQNGDLVVGGTTLQRWDGSQWHGYALTLDGAINDVAELPNGDLVVIGNFTTANGQVARRIVRFDGVAWSPMAIGLEGATSPLAWAVTALPNGDLIACGRFTTAGGRPRRNIARWSGGAWFPMSDGLDGSVRALAPLGGGTFAAGGDFLFAGAQQVERLAAWDGNAWQAIAPGVASRCTALRRTTNGDLLVAGRANALPNTHVARWSGGSWLPLGGGIPGDVRCLAELPNGDVVVAGQFNWAGFPVANIARWNGSTWSALGPGLDNRVNALVVLQNGDVVAGGAFSQRAARWDGVAWQALGAVGTEVHALAVLPNGDVMAGGDISSGVARTLQRWNGVAWQSFGANHSVFALAVHPSGAVFAGGLFGLIGTLSVNNLAMWDGTTWRAVTPFGSSFSGAVHALAVLDDGTLAIGGDMIVNVSGTGPGVHAVRRVLPCLYPVQSTPTACVGPAGAIELRADGVALLAGSLRCSARGFAPTSTVLVASGFATANAPLSQVLPGSPPGCDRLVSADDVTLVVPAAGTAVLGVPIPATVVLLGAVIHQQCVEVEFVGSTAVSLYGSNRLTTTIGTL